MVSIVSFKRTLLISTVMTLIFVGCSEKKEAFTRGPKDVVATPTPSDSNKTPSIADGTDNGPFTSEDEDAGDETVTTPEKKPKKTAASAPVNAPATTSRPTTSTLKNGEIQLPSPGGPEDFTQAPAQASAPQPVPSSVVVNDLPTPPPVIVDPSGQATPSAKGDTSTSSNSDTVTNSKSTAKSDSKSNAKSLAYKNAKAAAARIVSAGLQIKDLNNDDLEVSMLLKVREVRSVKTYILVGVLKPDQTKVNLKSETGIGPTAQVECTDEGGDCQSAVAKVKLSAPGAAGIVEILFGE